MIVFKDLFCIQFNKSESPHWQNIIKTTHICACARHTTAAVLARPAAEEKSVDMSKIYSKVSSHGDGTCFN